MLSGYLQGCNETLMPKDGGEEKEGLAAEVQKRSKFYPNIICVHTVPEISCHLSAF